MNKSQMIDDDVNYLGFKFELLCRLLVDEFGYGIMVPRI